MLFLTCSVHESERAHLKMKGMDDGGWVVFWSFSFLHSFGVHIYIVFLPTVKMKTFFRF